MLKDLSFSDIILFADGKTAYLKGTPEKGQQLVLLEQSYASEVSDLFGEVQQRYKNQPPGTSLRIQHQNAYYRTACYEDVERGNTFFLRRLANKVPAFSSIGLPSHLVDWFSAPQQKKGLILISGPQGGGKTTTASALVKTRLYKYGGHGITFEAPVEMPLAGSYGSNGQCFQTEIKSESELAGHIERAHRYSSPNIIYIGEIRSRYAASEALRIALGSNQQLVIATIHGLTATAALDRLLIWAREHDGNVACSNLAQTLTGIIHQEIIEKDNKRILNVTEFLMLPFDDETQGIRSKLRDGNLNLESDIRAQRNRVLFTGSFNPQSSPSTG
jgi:twitching motility protein PilT